MVPDAVGGKKLAEKPGAKANKQGRNADAKKARKEGRKEERKSAKDLELAEVSSNSCSAGVLRFLSSLQTGVCAEAHKQRLSCTAIVHQLG